jgi:hypothetical protein
MRAIQPIYAHRHHPPRHYDPVSRNIIPKPVLHVLGHDVLLTPIRMPYGVSLNPFADTWFNFQSGAWVVDVAL